MDNLADSVSDESSESDLFQSTKLMSTAKKAKPANEQAAKDIVKVILQGRSQEMCNVEAQHLFSVKITCFS